MNLKCDLYIIIFTLSCMFEVSAQQTEKRKTEFGFSPGVVLQKDFFADANFIFGKVENSKMIIGFAGTRLGLETNFQNGDNFIIAPKVGFEASVLIVVMRLSAANYFQNGNSEFRLIPEVGFTWGGFVNITYGYGIRFQTSEISQLGTHRLSVTFNLNKKIIKECLPRM